MCLTEKEKKTLNELIFKVLCHFTFPQGGGYNEAQETLGVQIYVHYLDCGDCFMGVYTC